MEQVVRIVEFIGQSLLNIWPYLLMTIPLSVVVKLTDSGKYIKGVFNKSPLISILLATLVGAVSPLCSCGVIPVIASLLLGGVPLAPVMSFWIASPSMDPEIFFLSVSALGWDLAVWRLFSTLVISLLAGLITHLLEKRGLTGRNYLRTGSSEDTIRFLPSFQEIRQSAITAFYRGKLLAQVSVRRDHHGIPEINDACCVQLSATRLHESRENGCGCDQSCKSGVKECGPIKPFYKVVLLESWKSTAMVARFMSLAFLVNALIVFYLPADLISGVLATGNRFSILIASLAGIPAYTSNITALPVISGLLKLGMNPAAALSFLIAGPVTTLPAMIAVKGLASRRVFLLYLSFSFFGALLAGYAYQLAAFIER